MKLYKTLHSRKSYGIFKIWTRPKVLGIYTLSAFILAAIFVLPVYGSMLFFTLFAQKQITLMIFGSILGLLSVWIYFGVPKKIGFWFGFFVGIFLFYWVGLSFRYSIASFLIPFSMLFVGIGYGIIFYFLMWSSSVFYRIFTLWIASYIHPFGFDWLVIESFFSYSIFGVDKLSFFSIIVAVSAMIYFKKFYKILAICILLIGTDLGNIRAQTTLPMKINVSVSSIPQNSKWQSQNLSKIIDDNMNAIHQAILKNDDMIILPETAFPILLNQSSLLEELKRLSTQIIIVTGGLRKENEQIFNSAYIFDNGNFHTIDKVVLAPFGEKIPLPDFMATPLQKLFFGNEHNLSNAKEPQDFKLGDNVFRSAICYEGTSKLMYNNKPKYMVLISNNGWFVPSIEPFFQRLLIKYYARLHGTSVIHSVNGSDSYIISPSVLGDIDIKLKGNNAKSK